MLLSLKVLFNDAAANSPPPRIDVEDTEGSGCFLCGVGEDGADISSESDSSPPVG